MGELCNYGSSSKAEPKNLNDSTWVLDLEDIEKESSVLLAKIRFAERASLSTKSVFKKGDVLYSKLRPYLDKVIVADENGVCTTEILPLTFSDEINPHFLLLTLKLRSFLDYVNGVTKGMKMPRLGTKEGKLALIPLPSLAEQNKVLSFLRDLESNSLKSEPYFNKTIEQEILNLHQSQLKGSEISTELDHQLALVKELRQAYLREAMQGKLVPQDPTDEPAEILLEKIKAEKEKLVAEKRIKRDKPLLPVEPDDIPYDLPNGWTWCRLGECIISAKDGPHFSPQYSTSGIPFVSTRNISPNGIDFSSAKFISQEYHDEISRKCKPEKGDILYTKGGTTGIARVNTYDVDFNVWVHVAVLKMTKFIDAFYLQHCLNSPFCYRQSQELTRGIGNQDLGLTRMVNILMALPPLAEQERIVARLERLMKFCDELEANIKQGITNADRLLQTALKEALEPTAIG